MERTAAVLVALALASPLAACGSDDADEGTRVSAPSSQTPGMSTPPAQERPSESPAEPSATPTPAPTSGGEAEEPAPEPFPGDVTPAVQEQTSGGPLGVRDVRVARHDGYDRVVFELAGRDQGQAGWRVEYVDSPRQQGSGDPVDVAGEAALSVQVLGTGHPLDTGVEEPAAGPALPGDLEVVQDVVLGSVFEGQYDAFIGTASRQPFRVFRLSDPERVVVDVQAP